MRWFALYALPSQVCVVRCRHNVWEDKLSCPLGTECRDGQCVPADGCPVELCKQVKERKKTAPPKQYWYR